MENSSLIGVLAIFTIGAALVGAIIYFGYFLSDPTNREHARRTLVDDEKSASAKHEESGMAPLRERLERSEASSHPDDPRSPDASQPTTHS